MGSNLGDLDALFSPNSIAVVGVSRNSQKIGRRLYENILQAGFKGDVFGVNPKAHKINGKKIYESISDLPHRPDLVVVVTPTDSVQIILQEAISCKVPAGIVISAGFGETGQAGRRLENQIYKMVKESGMRLLGPNCLGLMNTQIHLNSTFAADAPTRGRISCISQSGALTTALLDWASAHQIGFDTIVTLGNKLDVNENDVLEFLENRKQTEIIFMYLEDIAKGERLMQICSQISKHKPIIAIIPGQSEESRRAITSHTGSLAASYDLVNTALAQSGVLVVDSLSRAFDLLQLFSYGPKPRGGKTAVITNAGGPGILATDTIESQKSLSLAVLDLDTEKSLKDALPREASIQNPIDLVGDALAIRYQKALEIVLKESSVHNVVVLLTPQVTTQIKKTAQVISQMAKLYKKPIVSAFIGEKRVSEGIELLHHYQLPAYYFPSQAIMALSDYVRYYTTLCQKPIFKGFKQTHTVKNNYSEVGRYVSDLAAFTKLRQYGVPVHMPVVVKNLSEAQSAVGKIGFPVVLKLFEPYVAHKTDVGAVKVNIKNISELVLAYEQLVQAAESISAYEGTVKIGIQPMLESEAAFIAGVTKDQHFGYTILFGLGGIYTEIIKDISFRVIPTTMTELIEMISETKAAKILKGARGFAGIDYSKMAEVLYRLINLVKDEPDIMSIDLNPILLTQGRLIVVDAKIQVSS